MARGQARAAEPELPSLQFDEPLNWKAGKPITVGVLIKRLKTLHNELKTMPQDEVDRESLARPAKELCNNQLIQHKDKGVKAYTACCLAEMLRIHAPDAPYTGNQLRDIFDLFVKQLKGLGDKEAPYFQQYLTLLDSLASVKSIVLLSDIPRGEEVTKSFFLNFFDMAKPDIPKNVEYLMTDVLIQLVDECTTLPQEAVDIIITQFLRAFSINSKANKAKLEKNKEPGQQTLTSFILPPAYNMAKMICNTCVDKMSRYICQYFTEVIVDVSPSGKDKRDKRSSLSPEPDSDEEDDEPQEADLEELDKAHMLVRELWRACPGVLQNVVPQLDQELVTENAQLRQLAVETIGEMAILPIFNSTFPGAWASWVQRSQDKAPQVRAKWAEAAVKIVEERIDSAALPLVDKIAEKLLDSDERVRLATVRALGALNYASITNKLSGENPAIHPHQPEENGRSKSKASPGTKVLQNLADRVKDKRYAVRAEAMQVLAKMWDMAYEDIAAGNELAIRQLGWIPGRLLETLYLNERSTDLLLMQVMYEVLFPATPEAVESSKTSKGKEQDADEAEKDKQRVRRLLTMVKHMETKAKKAFFALMQRQSFFSKLFEGLTSRAETYNGGAPERDENAEEGTQESASTLKQRLSAVIDAFAPYLVTDTVEKTKTDLWRWVNGNYRKLYALARTTMSVDSSFATVVKNLKDIIKKIESTPSMNHTTLMHTLRPLLIGSALLVYNKSHIPAIVEYSRSNEDDLAESAHDVLRNISAENPVVFKAHVNTLCSILQEQSPDKAGVNVDPGVVDTLKACSQFARLYPQEFPQDRKVFKALASFALHGNNFRAAKYAVSIIISAAPRKEMYAADLLKEAINNYSYGSETFLAQLSTISQLMYLAPQQVEEHIEKISEICKSIVSQVRTPVTPENDVSWVKDADLDDECWAKILALKALVNRVRAYANEKKLNKFTEPVYHILVSIIAKEGELSKKKDTPKSHQSRLRLAAAKLYLKMALQKPLDDIITPIEFDKLALVAQDPRPQVRRAFIEKLKKYLAGGRLSAKYYSIIFLVAHEPMADLREDCKKWLRAKAVQERKASSTALENVFPRLLSLLAHHQDFGKSEEDLVDFAKYIMFYLETIACEENLSLIFYLAQRVKQVGDAVNPAESENLYYLSDLSQALIRRYEDEKNWSMQSYPGRIALPANLFTALSSSDVAHEIARKTFLPDGLDERLNALVKTRASKKRRSDAQGLQTPAAKRTKVASLKKTPKTPRSPKTPGKTPKKARRSEVPESERRRSGRVHAAVTYAESDDDSEEEDEMDWEDEGGEIRRPKKTGRGRKDDEEDDEEGDSSDEELTEPESDIESEIEADQAKSKKPASPSPDDAEPSPSPSPSPEPEPSPARRTRGRAATTTTKATIRTKPSPQQPKPKAKPPARQSKGKAAAKRTPTRGTRASARTAAAKKDNEEEESELSELSEEEE